MIEFLKEIERDVIIDILKEPIEKFKTILIDYEHPYVERLQYDLEDGYKLSFHNIHPCESPQSLYHPHPWPSAIHVLRGNYEMGIAYSENEEHYKQVNATGIFNDDIKLNEVCKISTYSDFYYEMVNRNGWHYVRPIECESMSVMLMGPKWYDGSKPTRPLQPLSIERALELQSEFLYYYNR